LAHGLFSPVIFGMSKPSLYKISQNTSSELLLAEELFNIEPSMQRQQKCLLSNSLVTITNSSQTAKTATSSSAMPPPHNATTSGSDVLFIEESDGGSSSSNSYASSETNSIGESKSQSNTHKTTHRSNSSSSSSTTSSFKVGSESSETNNSSDTASTSNTIVSTLAIKNGKTATVHPAPSSNSLSSKRRPPTSFDAFSFLLSRRNFGANSTNSHSLEQSSIANENDRRTGFNESSSNFTDRQSNIKNQSRIERKKTINDSNSGILNTYFSDDEDFNSNEFSSTSEDENMVEDDGQMDFNVRVEEENIDDEQINQVILDIYNFRYYFNFENQ
jgi:hypothetical protein